MQCEDKSEVHQLLGLGVQCARRMCLLEEVGVALARTEVPAPKLRHCPPRKTQTGRDNDSLKPIRDRGDSKTTTTSTELCYRIRRPP